MSEEYERLMNPEKAFEDSKPPRIKEEPMSDISFPVSEEPEADLASGDQALPMGVLSTHNERMTSGLDGDHSPHTSGEPGIPNHTHSVASFTLREDQKYITNMNNYLALSCSCIVIIYFVLFVKSLFFHCFSIRLFFQPCF